MGRLINSYAQNSWVNILHLKINIARRVFKNLKSTSYKLFVLYLIFECLSVKWCVCVNFSELVKPLPATFHRGKLKCKYFLVNRTYIYLKKAVHVFILENTQARCDTWLLRY